MTTRRTRKPITPQPEPKVLEVGVTTEDAKKFHDWEKSQIDNAIDIARKVGAKVPELTHEEMLEIAAEREGEAATVEVVEVKTEKPPIEKVKFVAIPPAPDVAESVVEKPVTASSVKNPRMIPRVTRGIRGATKRG